MTIVERKSKPQKKDKQKPDGPDEKFLALITDLEAKRKQKVGFQDALAFAGRFIAENESQDVNLASERLVEVGNSLSNLLQGKEFDRRLLSGFPNGTFVSYALSQRKNGHNRSFDYTLSDPISHLIAYCELGRQALVREVPQFREQDGRIREYLGRYRSLPE